MKTGTSRIVGGVILTVLFGLGTLRNLFVLPMALAATGPTAYVIGGIIGAAIGALILVLAIRMLRSGLQQRKAYQLASIRPAIPGRF